MQPRATLAKGSPDWCLETLRHLARLWGDRADFDRWWGETWAEVEEFKVWEIYPEGDPYGSPEALLAAWVEATPTQVEERKLGQWGGDRKSDQVDIVNLKTPGGNRADYLRARLKRDHPDILAKLDAGEFKSARAAAIEAGIVTVPTPLDLLRRAWKKASEDERAEFLTEIA